MAMPSKFHIPWGELDPTFRHGGIDGELENQFVSPDLGDNWQTKNVDNLKIFRTLNEVATSISMHHESDKEGYPGRSLVEEVLRGLNLINEQIVDVSKSCSTRFFGWTHAIPPVNDYDVRPVRFPLRNNFAQEVVHYLIGDMVECAELNRNGSHAGLDPQSANVLIAPLYNLKANVIKYYFDTEVAGELSSFELDSIMGGKFRPGPTVSYPDETAELPDAADVIEAMNGADVVQWFPTEPNWVVFGKLARDRYTPERIYQPEGKRSVTEDVAPESGTMADGTPLTQQP